MLMTRWRRSMGSLLPAAKQKEHLALSPNTSGGAEAFYAGDARRKGVKV